MFLKSKTIVTLVVNTEFIITIIVFSRSTGASLLNSEDLGKKNSLKEPGCAR